MAQAHTFLLLKKLLEGLKQVLQIDENILIDLLNYIKWFNLFLNAFLTYEMILRIHVIIIITFVC